MRQSKLHSLLFWKLCIGSMFFFASMNSLLPELPLYLESFGGSQYKGLLIGLFTLTACLSRPFSGKISDLVGRVPVMIFGAIVVCSSAALYPFVFSIWSLLLLRLFHGMSAGFNPTGTTAYIADIVPEKQRGEAMGWVGLINNVGAGLGPVMGSEIKLIFGMNGVFIMSAIFGLISIISIYNMKETLPKPKPISKQILKIHWVDIWEPRVWLPAMMMLMMVFSYGTVLTIGFDLAMHCGIKKGGYFLLILTFSSILIRILSGKFSDHYGRKRTMMIGLALLTVSNIVMGTSHQNIQFILASFLMGMSNGINNPTAFAWASDLAHSHYKGRAMATLFMALEIGIGIGALGSAYIFNLSHNSYLPTFVVSASISFCALLILIFNSKINWKKYPSNQIKSNHIL